MQIGKKRKTVCHNLQSFSTFAEKQRAVELEDKKKFKSMVYANKEEPTNHC